LNVGTLFTQRALFDQNKDEDEENLDEIDEDGVDPE
jgi:hypothetical protein